ncbi:MAG: hypothetical protein PHO46_03055 [Thermoguttaceae bacterium]|jgi:hypothetical protein|nr:hypothetical protein [Thermoguttaceae bacterium]
MKNVICMKWGTKFPPEYVNILASRVKKNITGDYRFVCFTDDPTGLSPLVETRPLPEMSGLEGRPERGWRKLTLFQEKLSDLEGSALFLDLDIVIVESLDPFFETPGDFRIIEDWNLKGTKIGNSSVFRFEIGSRPDVLEYFLANREQVYKAHRNEQAYLSWAIAQKQELLYWDPTWCLSFKRHFMRRFPLGYFLEPKQRPGTKIIVFHGNPNPDCAIYGWRNKTGLRAVKKTPWIAELWTE